MGIQNIRVGHMAAAREGMVGSQRLAGRPVYILKKQKANTKRGQVTELQGLP